MKNCAIYLFLSLSLFCQVRSKEILPEHLIHDLGSTEFASREKAHAELLVWALKHTQEATSEFLRLYREDDDPEVRKRSREILKELANVDYLSDGQGYLGILMQEQPLEVGPDGKVMFGIRILDVMEGSPAEQADFKVGDVIISLDGKGWVEFGAVTAFSESVAAKKPLVEVILMIRKAQGEPFRVSVKLGKRPIQDLQFGGDLGQLEQQAKEEHFKEWLRKFQVD